ncbi:Transferase [Macleaya cordata]|uniref:Transferase n=1 Tax=Macleaya cordata TaxID=56857 RepID=A0A200R1N6_MACCD|nr:Transferase [Macleaya cordata]
MTFSVIRSSRCIVPPAAPTPSGALDLSVIDKLLVLRCKARTLHVFSHGGVDAAKVIREALSKALVPYYPLAGRLEEPVQGELQIACTGEGVWFVEASADCTLDAVNYFDNVPMVPHDELLPDQPPDSDGVDPLVLMQVTQFTCGGFVIGLIFCHSICDGLGAAQFLNAVGEFARGLQVPSITPVWYRETLPTRQRAVNAEALKLPPLPPPMPEYQLEHASIDIPLDVINKLKHEFLDLTGKTCSAFDIVAASLWSRRTRAINLEKDTDVKLVFFANTRKILDPPLPEGFYGNCFFPVRITTSSRWLVEASDAEVVKLIQNAKTRLPIEFTKWIEGDELDDGEDPFAPPLVYTTLFISEWGRLGFNQVDYGWGRPVHVVPIQGSNIIPVGIVGSLPTPKNGIRLMTWCVEGTHLPSLIEQTMNLT